MRISYTFRNMESSEGMKTYASEKVAKLQKFARAPLHVDATFSVERHLHRIDITVTADGHPYTSHSTSEDMYASVDLVVDKIGRQMRDAKDTQKDHRHGP